MTEGKYSPMLGCWNSTRPKRSSTKGKRASAGRSRRLKHSCIGTSATRTKAIDMTDDPGERQGDILSRHAATLGRHLKSSPCPQFFPTPHPCSRWRHSWADGFPPGCCSSASCAPFCRMPTSSASGSASAMPTRSGTGGFPIPSRLPCSWAVLVFGVAPLFLRGSRLMGFTVGLLAVSSHILLDAMTNGGLGVAAFSGPSTKPGTSATGALSGFRRSASRGSCRNGGSPSCSQNCAGYGLRVWLS